MERPRHPTPGGAAAATGTAAPGSAAGGVVDGTPDGELDDVDGGNECVICMEAARDTAALPCRHMCLCHACAGALRTQTNKCPICRNPIEKLLHIKIKKAADAEAPPLPADASAP
jgi:hypothetical protein